MKKTKEGQPISNWVWLATVLLLLVIPFIAHSLKLKQRPPTPRVETRNKDDARLYELQQRYYAGKARHKDVWWLDEPPSLGNNAQIESVIKKQADLIKETISTYKTLSPLATSIARHFESFFVSIAINRSSSVTVMTTGETARIGNIPEITFVPRDGVRIMGAPYSLYWRSDWGLIMNAMSLPRPVFAGFLFHELGHGYLHPVHPDTKHYAHSSREYALEEIRMHELESLVFDKASNGAFGQVVVEVASRKKETASFKEALYTLREGDLRRLDESLSATEVGVATSSLLFAHYLIAIGLEHIKLQNGSDEKKVLLFLWAQTILH